MTYCGKWKLDINYTKTQKSLDSFSDYCGKWKLDINYTKTQKSLDSFSDYCGKWMLDINYTKTQKNFNSFSDYCGKWKSLDSFSDYCGKWKLDINYTKTQKSLDSFGDYCGKWKLDINYTKTKCTTFTKGNTKEKNYFAINNQIIENVKEFKYLGITINGKGSFTPTLEDLNCKGSRALYAIASKIHLKDTPIKTMIKIFDSCVAPTLLYGSEVWAPYITHDYTKWESSPIERIHTQYLKGLLEVNRSTTNILVRGETGRNPLFASTLTRNINYIKYLNNKCNSTLVKQAPDYETSKKDNRQTILSLVKIHENTRTLQIANNEDIWTISKYKLSKAVYEEFNSLWQGQIPLYTKAATYKLFKDRIKFENDLTNIKNRKQRVTFTKLRLSDHNLLIEEGRRRRPRIPREQRLCPLCSQKVENEIHFLITCDAYTERFELFNRLSTTVPVIFNLDNISKFAFLMSMFTIILINCYCKT